MLSVFPDLLSYGLAAPLLLRIVLGVFLILRASASWKQPREWPATVSTIIFFVSGVLLFIGLFTQVAALAILILTLITLIREWFVLKNMDRTDIATHIFILAIALSLMLSGAGAFAIDLPL